MYIYDKHTNEKKQTFKNVIGIKYDNGRYLLDLPDSHKYIDPCGIKLVVYGF